MTCVLFLWTQCVLDRRSGGALEMKTVLEVLAAAGFDCHSIGMTLFDGRDEFPLERLIGPEHAAPCHHGRILEADHRGVRHHLFRTASTLGPNVTREEAGHFLRAAAHRLRTLRPDIVLTTGGSPVARALHTLAGEAVACRVFYLANPAYDRPEVFAGFDRVWSPTRALAEYHRERLGVAAELFPNVLDANSFVETDGAAAPRIHRARRYVTMVNPSPEKGATLFFALARLAARERPEIRFLAVEARAGRAQWRAWGMDPDELPNVLWLRNRRDMRPVYRRTAVLLHPSYCFEAAGRVPVEAQLSGIPVLATRRGGLPEQLNGGAFLFDAPTRCIENYGAVPNEVEVRPWLDRIVDLLDDAKSHTRAAASARAAADRLHPRNRHPQVVRTFRELARCIGAKGTADPS